MRVLRGTTLLRHLRVTLRRLLPMLPHLRRALASPSASLHLFCLFTTSRFVPAPATSGLRATGLTVMLTITGCPEPGCSHLLSGFSGPQVIGVMSGAVISGTRDIGDRTLDITAASTMASAMEVSDSRAAIGITERSSTTPR